MKKFIILAVVGILALAVGVGARYYFEQKSIVVSSPSVQTKAENVNPVLVNEEKIPEETTTVTQVPPTIVVVVVSGDSALASARDNQRKANVSSLANAAFQFDLDYNGVWNCAGKPMPKIATSVKSSSGGFNAAPCLVPDYLFQMVIDPIAGHWTSATDYDSGYAIYQDAQGKFVVTAPSAEGGEISGRSY